MNYMSFRSEKKNRHGGQIFLCLLTKMLDMVLKNSHTKIGARCQSLIGPTGSACTNVADRMLDTQGSFNGVKMPRIASKVNKIMNNITQSYLICRVETVKTVSLKSSGLICLLGR